MLKLEGFHHLDVLLPLPKGAVLCGTLMLKGLQRVDQSEALLFYAHPDKKINENKLENDSECVNGKMTVVRAQSGSVGAVE